MTTETTAPPPLEAHPRGFRGWVAARMMLYRKSDRARVRWVLSLLNPQPDDRVLDVGIGPGYSTRLIAERLSNGLVVGVDRAPLMIAAAQRRLARFMRARRATLMCVDVLDLPRFDVTFDKVVSINTFQFHEKPADVLQLLHSRMTPGGLIAIAVQPSDRDPANPGSQRYAAQIAEQLEANGFSHAEAHFNASLGPVPSVCVIGRA